MPRIVNAHWDENCAGVAAARVMRRGAANLRVPLGIKSKIDSSARLCGSFASRLMPRIVNARGEIRQASAATVRVGLQGAGNLWVHLCIQSELSCGVEKSCWLPSRLTAPIVNARRGVRQAGVATVRARRHSADPLRVRLRIKSELISGTDKRCWFSSRLAPRIVNARGEVRQASVATTRARRHGAGNLRIHLRMKS